MLINCIAAVVDAPPKTYHSPVPSRSSVDSPAATDRKPVIEDARTKNEPITMAIPMAAVMMKMAAAQKNPAFDRLGTTIGCGEICVMNRS